MIVRRRPKTKKRRGKTTKHCPKTTKHRGTTKKRCPKTVKLRRKTTKRRGKTTKLSSQAMEFSFKAMKLRGRVGLLGRARQKLVERPPSSRPSPQGDMDDAAFEEISDLRHRVAAVIKRDDEAGVAIFAHHHGFKGVNVRAAGLVFLFHLDGIPAFFQTEFAFLLFARRGAVVSGLWPDLSSHRLDATPMSPTCTLFGMPPRAMTAHFSNSPCRRSRREEALIGNLQPGLK